MSSLFYHDDYYPQSTELIFDFGDTPIIFLMMNSDKEGFVIEHAPIIDSNNPIILFTYHQIIKQNGRWNKNFLFCFKVPTHLLLESEQQLYESLLPLLPRIIQNKVYFVDCSHNDHYYLEPYVYDLATQTIQKIALSKKQGHYFVPLLCGEKFYCGGTLDQKEQFISFLT